MPHLVSEEAALVQLLLLRCLLSVCGAMPLHWVPLCTVRRLCWLCLCSRDRCSSWQRPQRLLPAGRGQLLLWTLLRLSRLDLRP